MQAEVIGAIDPLASAGVDMGLTAGATALLGPLGPIAAGFAGPVVKDLIAKVAPGPSTTWQNVPAAVHAWCTKNASWALVDWMKAKMPDQFATIDQVRAANVLFALETQRNIVGTPGGQFPEAADLPKIYAAIGIDYAATKAKIEAAGWHGNVKDSEIVYLPAQQNPVVAKVTALATVANKSLPPDLAANVKAKAQMVTQKFTKAADDSGGNGISMPLILGGAALLFFITRSKK